MGKITPRTAVVTIYSGDELQRINELASAAQAAAVREQEERALREQDADRPRRQGQPSLAPAESPSRAEQLAAEHDELVQKSGLRITLKALRRPEWKALVAQHPPRENHKADEAVGVNEDSFKDALVPASIVEPDLSADDLDDLADADFDRLYFTAFGLNRLSGGDPKADLASRLSQKSSETSS